jgi:rubrerythrin
MLAIVVAVIILLKSKGSAAKAAGNVGGAAARSKGYDPIPVVQAVGSMFIDEESEQEEDASAGPEMLFRIKCGGCGATFAPVPPAARCPFCNEAALAV